MGHEWTTGDKGDCDTDNSDMDSISSFQSVDEGAIAILSMDQIRNMRAKQQAAQEVDLEVSSDEEKGESKEFVKPTDKFNLEQHLCVEDEENGVNISTIDLDVSESVKSERIEPVCTGSSSKSLL